MFISTSVFCISTEVIEIRKSKFTKQNATLSLTCNFLKTYGQDLSGEDKIQFRQAAEKLAGPFLSSVLVNSPEDKDQVILDTLLAVWGIVEPLISSEYLHLGFDFKAGHLKSSEKQLAQYLIRLIFMSECGFFNIQPRFFLDYLLLNYDRDSFHVNGLADFVKKEPYGEFKDSVITTAQKHVESMTKDFFAGKRSFHDVFNQRINLEGLPNEFEPKDVLPKGKKLFQNLFTGLEKSNGRAGASRTRLTIKLEDRKRQECMDSLSEICRDPDLMVQFAVWLQKRPDSAGLFEGVVLSKGRPSSFSQLLLAAFKSDIKKDQEFRTRQQKLSEITANLEEEFDAQEPFLDQQTDEAALNLEKGSSSDEWQVAVDVSQPAVELLAVVSDYPWKEKVHDRVLRWQKKFNPSVVGSFFNYSSDGEKVFGYQNLSDPELERQWFEHQALLFLPWLEKPEFLERYFVNLERLRMRSDRDRFMAQAVFIDAQKGVIRGYVVASRSRENGVWFHAKFSEHLNDLECSQNLAQVFDDQQLLGLENVGDGFESVSSYQLEREESEIIRLKFKKRRGQLILLPLKL